MARFVTVISISFGGGSGSGSDRYKSAREIMLARIDDAATQSPDIIVLPETFTALGSSQEDWIGSAEEITGPTPTAIAQKAREHGAYITCPIVERRDGKLHNAILLFDRKGELAARYEKNFPTIGEMEDDILPGTEAVVAETDMGRIGFLICFDLNFEELAEQLRKKKAELVLFSSMFRGGTLMSHWAVQNQCYLVSSTPRENSRIVNPMGRVLIESSDYQLTITKTINLDYAVLHLDYNHAKTAEIHKKFGPSVEMEVHSPEGRYMLTSNHPDKSVNEIIQEFELERLDDYFNRARKVREEYLSK
ncbi:MAG TPA: carbon-nitrogen hydrolase family protein [bacterium]|nr:carbon-nitrogen hydrolase family protein [bacterium]HQL60835.1 carbon-nitrogen hydrolase family protein [bacterium]